jgi:hypothetical protein
VYHILVGKIKHKFPWFAWLVGSKVGRVGISQVNGERMDGWMDGCLWLQVGINHSPIILWSNCWETLRRPIKGLIKGHYQSLVMGTPILEPLHTWANGRDHVIVKVLILNQRPYHWHGVSSKNLCTPLIHDNFFGSLGLHLLVQSELGWSSPFQPMRGFKMQWSRVFNHVCETALRGPLDLGSFHTWAKSCDHELVRARKRCPKTIYKHFSKWCSVVTCPRV